MRLALTADTHGLLPNVEASDVLVHAGDLCPDMEPQRQASWLRNEWMPWAESLPVKAVIVIAGNHDFMFEYPGLMPARWPKRVKYLQDSGTVIEGLRFWGTPWVPVLRNWAFYGDDRKLDEVYDYVPDGTDVMVTHGPPLGHCDKTVPMFGSVNAGARQALETIKRVRPKLVVCGHIHEGHGLSMVDHTTVENVSYVNEDYDPVHGIVYDELS